MDLKKILLATLCITYPSFKCYGDLITAFNFDYDLYKGRGGVEAGMPYVRDLNRRIQEQTNKRDERAFSNLTRILNYVLTTGACFGISKKAPTKEQMEDLKPSFSYIHSLAERVDETMKAYVKIEEYTYRKDTLYKVHELANEYETYSPEDLPGYLKAEGATSMLDYTQQYVVREFQRTSFFESASEDQKNRIKTQSNAILSQLNKIAPKDSKVNFVHDSNHDKPKGWYRFNGNNDAIVRDNLGHEYYVMVTPGDGACWMHSIAQDENEPRSARDLADRLKKLTDKERSDVCDKNPNHFISLLKNHGGKVLKGKFLDEFKGIRPLFKDLFSEKNKKKILDFCKKKEIFNVLVESRGTSDSKALFNNHGGTNWGNTAEDGWTGVLSYVLKRNILNISYQISNITDNLLNQIDPANCTLFSRAEASWSFMIKQPEGNHFSALYPIEWEEVGKQHYLRTHAKKNYFAQYMNIGTPTSQEQYDEEQLMNIESGVYIQRYRINRLFGEL